MTEGTETLPTLCVLRYHISGEQNKDKGNNVVITTGYKALYSPSPLPLQELLLSVL